VRGRDRGGAQKRGVPIVRNIVRTSVTVAPLG
jgi:hypothetical protein